MLAIFAMVFGIPSAKRRARLYCRRAPAGLWNASVRMLAPNLTCRGSDGDSPNNGPLRPARGLDRNMSTLRLFIRV